MNLLPGTLIAIALVERMGRRTLLLVSMVTILFFYSLFPQLYTSVSDTTTVYIITVIVKQGTALGGNVVVTGVDSSGHGVSHTGSHTGELVHL